MTRSFMTQKQLACMQIFSFQTWQELKSNYSLAFLILKQNAIAGIFITIVLEKLKFGCQE